MLRRNGATSGARRRRIRPKSTCMASVRALGVLSSLDLNDIANFVRVRGWRVSRQNRSDHALPDHDGVTDLQFRFVRTPPDRVQFSVVHPLLF